MQRISRFPDELQFIEISSEGQTEAILGFAEGPLTCYLHELSFPTRFGVGDMHVAGAWDERSFAVRVRTPKYVKALTQFHKAIRAGKVVFAGTFFRRPDVRLRGVILANTDYLNAEDRDAIERAQKEYESRLRLQARDESMLIYQEMRRRMPKRLDVGHIWAVWADKEESGVLYAYNPGYRLPAEYYGPYTKDELLQWAAAGASYLLKPSVRKAS